MRVKIKTGVMIGGGVALLLVIVAIVAALRYDINSYKSKIETVAS